MNDDTSFLEKQLTRSRLELDARTKPGTADALVRDKLAERMDYYGKVGSPKAKQILSRLATNGLPTDQALATVQQALGEVLASAVTSSPKREAQPAPAPVRVMAPTPTPPKKSASEVQAESDVALLDCYAAISDPQERTAWYREHGAAHSRAWNRITTAAADAKQAKIMASFRAEQSKAMKANDQALAEQFNALTHPIAKYRFAQEHPDLMGKIERNEIS